jgi:hypothetical protein
MRTSGIVGEREKVPFFGLEPSDIEAQLAAGSRFVVFEYCISLIIVTLRQPSRVHLIPAGKTGLLPGFPYTILSLLLGWWGIPWGLIYTPLVVVTNLAGGRDITAAMRAMLSSPALTPTPWVATEKRAEKKDEEWK